MDGGREDALPCGWALPNQQGTQAEQEDRENVSPVLPLHLSLGLRHTVILLNLPITDSGSLLLGLQNWPQIGNYTVYFLVLRLQSQSQLFLSVCLPPICLSLQEFIHLVVHPFILPIYLDISSSSSSVYLSVYI